MEVRQPLVFPAGEHHFQVEYAPEMQRRAAQLGADAVRGNASPTHAGDLAHLMTVTCTCNEPSCGVAVSYVRGLIEGWRMGSIVAMAASDIHDQLRASSPVASAIRAAMVGMNPNGNGVDVLYDNEGRVIGTRPRETPR